MNDFAATFSAALMTIGDQLGLYRVLADEGPLAASELAERTGTVEPLLRPWLANQAAAGYVEYDPVLERYRLTPEQRLVLVDDSSPACLMGGYEVVLTALRAQRRVAELFRAGERRAWSEQDDGLFRGAGHRFRPGYLGHLHTSWLPAVDGVCERLESGAIVADVGHGASTIVMAEAFPRSELIGFDSHAPSIERAHLVAETPLNRVFEVRP